MTIEEKDLEQESVEPQSELRSQIEAAYSQLEKEDSEPTESAEVSAQPEQKQISDQPDRGSEVKTPEGKPPVAEKQVAFDPKELETGPKSWSKVDRQHWAQIPKEAKEAILRREQQAYRHITATGSKIGEIQSQYREVDEAFKPFENELKQAGVSKGRVVAELLKEHQFRQSSPKEYIQHLAAQLKIDLLDIAIESDIKEAPEIRRQRWELEEERKAIASQHQEVQQHRQAQEVQQYVSLVNQWADESVNGIKLRPHFQEVRNAMREMIPHAQAEYPHLSTTDVLDMVYERALEHPQFAHLASRKVTAAKQAGASIGGRTGVTGTPGREPKSIREAMEMAYNEILSR